MLKKLFSVFKKKEEVVVEPEVVEEVEIVEEPPAIEILVVDEEEAKDFDVDTSQRFEIYMGETEETVTLVNKDLDFATLDEAKAYANYIITRDYSEQGVVVFIHEETIDENGQPVTNRHF
jgi:hypothetical protein